MGIVLAGFSLALRSKRAFPRQNRLNGSQDNRESVPGQLYSITVGSGWPGDVIITDDVMSLSRPNTLFFQLKKARLFWLFRPFLRASIVAMGMDAIPGISASIQDGFCILRWLYDLRIWRVLRGSRLQKTDLKTRLAADWKALAKRPLLYLNEQSNGVSTGWLRRQKHNVFHIIQGIFK